MHMIAEVGARLDPDVRWPEGTALRMFAGEPVQLMIFLSRPHVLEVQAVSQAPTRFAWVDGENVSVLAYRLGPVLAWSEAAYTPHTFGPEEGLPGVDAGAKVKIALVDRESNIVRAAHTVRWPVEFAAAVRKSVARMRETSYSAFGYEHALGALHRRYPTTEDLVVDRADVHCVATPVP
jgi:hypothetical protein